MSARIPPAREHRSNPFHAVGYFVDHVQERRIRISGECAKVVSNMMEGPSRLSIDVSDLTSAPETKHDHSAA